MKSLAEKLIMYNKALALKGKLPKGIRVMNPFAENEYALKISSAFYRKYYNDHDTRKLILGINPGRLGAGVTGIPFTDPKRLSANCGIDWPGETTHEPSSVFVYHMIDAFGGPELFYHNFLIHSVCPLGFTKNTNRGTEINYNYFDSPELQKATYPFIVSHLQKLIAMGISTEHIFCFGTGKNMKFLLSLNIEKNLFKKITTLEHPRYIMQYKSREIRTYIKKYLAAFESPQ